MSPFIRSLFFAALAVSTLHAHEGPLDPAFGDGGMRNYGFLPVNGEVTDHAIAACPGPNGTLVVVGSASTGQRIVTARLLPNGDYDTSFSTDGKETFSLLANEGSTFSPAVCQSTGVVIARHTRDAGGEEDLQIVRVLKDTGLPDPAFASNGVLVLDLDTRRSGLGKEEVPLGVNALPSGEFAVTGYVIDGNGSLRAFVALLNPAGVVENTAFFDTGRFFTATIEAPDGRLWLFGENYSRVSRTVLNRQTLAQEDYASVAAPPNTFYLAGNARPIDADTVAMAVVQTAADYTSGEPRLALFHGSDVSVLDLPSAAIAGTDHAILPVPLGSPGVTVLPGRRILFGATARSLVGFGGVGEHFAMAHVGRTAATDRIESAFGTGGAQTAALRPHPCTGEPPSQNYTRMTLWGNRPVFVGYAFMDCAIPGNGRDYLVGRIETNYLFADDFD